jgi:hypothetical protein
MICYSFQTTYELIYQSNILGFHGLCFNVMVFWTVAPCSLCAGYQSFGEPVTSVFRVETSREQTVIYACGKVVNLFRRRGKGNRRHVPLKMCPVSFTSAKSLLPSEVANFSYFFIFPLGWKCCVHERAVCVLAFPARFSHRLEFSPLPFLLRGLYFQPIYETFNIRNVTQ